MPFLIPLLVVGAVAGIVLFEKLKGGTATARPQLPAGGGAPGSPPLTAVPGMPVAANPFANWTLAQQAALAHLLPIHMQPPQSPQPAANPILSAAQNLLQTTQSAGGTMGQLYHEVILNYLNQLVGDPTQATLSNVIGQLSKGDLGPEGDSVLQALEPLSSQTQTGFWGGVWGEDRMAGTEVGQQSPQSDCVCVEPAQIAAVCAVIVAQAMQGGAGAAPAPMPLPAPQQQQPAAPVAQSGARRGMGHKMKKGQAYFVSYPAGMPLSTILWEPATVADAPASPTKMVADPTQNVRLPTMSVPQTTPPGWLGHFSPGRAIAVMTWIGPDGGNDPGVGVWGTYSAGRA